MDDFKKMVKYLTAKKDRKSGGKRSIGGKKSKK
jgi:hypothetical protein